MPRLGNFIKQIRGVSYKPLDLKNEGNGIPLLRANNITRHGIDSEDLVYVDPAVVNKNQLLQKGDVVICTSSGSQNMVGKAAIYTDECTMTFGAFCKCIRILTIESVNPEFLRLFFFSNKYRNSIAEASNGTNIHNAKTGDIDNLNINIPALAEQNFAVSLMSKLFLMLSKKRNELQQLDSLVKSRFIEMFGDPINNPKKWPTKKLSILCPFNKYNGPVDEKDGGYWLLNLDMVESNTGKILDVLIVPKKRCRQFNYLLWSRLRFVFKASPLFK